MSIPDRARRFCDDHNLQLPILMAPMAGASPVALAAAVARAGGMGACGALLMDLDAIAEWIAGYRSASDGPLQMNLWVPDPAPARNADREAAIGTFLSRWGPTQDTLTADVAVPFIDQCDALLDARPAVMSSIMGLFPEDIVERMKSRGIRWFATATTVSEAREAERAGADAIVAQGAEAGGHRGAFDAERADRQLIGLVSLVPAIADAVRVPVIATGGIADARGVAAALVLGASAVQIGTSLLRTPEAGIASSWADAIGQAHGEDTATTRAFSGRLGRSLRTDYTTAAEKSDAPPSLPYPLQRSATGPMRLQGSRDDDIDRIQAWAGQSAGLAKAAPAGEVVVGMWTEAKKLLQG